jgi:gas vesicle protein
MIMLMTVFIVGMIIGGVLGSAIMAATQFGATADRNDEAARQEAQRWQQWAETALKAKHGDHHDYQSRPDESGQIH